MAYSADYKKAAVGYKQSGHTLIFANLYPLPHNSLD
jgi:hypothetical protein